MVLNLQTFMKRHLTDEINWLALSVLVIFIYPIQLAAQEIEVPYVATPPEVVDEMLKIAGAGDGDYLVDLGSGDGRIVIEAAKRGAIGHGVDLDGDLVQLSFKKAEKAGVSDRVIFFEEDIFETDFSMASVVTIYMSNDINLRLRPLLFDKLKPGTRVVSHIFHMDDWQPDRQTAVNRHNIYKWIIPADVEGTWKWRANEVDFQLSLNQEFQKIAESGVIISDENKPYELIESSIRGERITIVIKFGEHKYVYNGKVSGDEINGSVQIRDGDDSRIESWNAERISAISN